MQICDLYTLQCYSDCVHLPDSLPVFPSPGAGEKDRSPAPPLQVVHGYIPILQNQQENTLEQGHGAYDAGGVFAM